MFKEEDDQPSVQVTFEGEVFAAVLRIVPVVEEDKQPSKMTIKSLAVHACFKEQTTVVTTTPTGTTAVTTTTEFTPTGTTTTTVQTTTGKPYPL